MVALPKRKKHQYQHNSELFFTYRITSIQEEVVLNAVVGQVFLYQQIKSNYVRGHCIMRATYYSINE